MSKRDVGLAKYHCSFCAKSATEVSKLVAGPGVYICDECVALCNEVVNLEAPRPMGAPWELDPTLDEVLDSLPKVASASATADDYLRHWVEKARSLGATWERIGEAMGTSRQAAWERFAER